jgi:hypothetical protein
MRTLSASGSSQVAMFMKIFDNDAERLS